MRIILGALLASTALTLAAGAQAATTQRVSVGAGNSQANGGSFVPSISADGRYVVLTTQATNLVPAGGPPPFDIVRRDRKRGTTAPVVVGIGGAPPNGPAIYGFTSANGRFAAFGSAATNLVPGDTNGVTDVFVRDFATGRTTRASVATGGGQGDVRSIPAFNGITSDGRFVAFTSVASTIVPGTGAGHLNLFVRDTRAGRTTLVTAGPGGEPGDAPPPPSSLDTINASLTPGGRVIAFDSDATNLVPGDTNGLQDVFVRDLGKGVTRLVSAAADGGPADDFSLGPFIDRDARLVAFSSFATNLVAGDTNGRYDAFLRDLGTGRTTLLSRAAGGGQADGDTLVLNMTPDGRFVLLWSTATDLVAGATTAGANAFLLDRRTGRVTLVSRGASGRPGDGPVDGTYGSLTDDGTTAAFASDATDLVPNDTNGLTDVFVRVLRGSAR